MSEDIAEKIMCVIAENYGDMRAVDSKDINKLISEFKDCQTENKELWAVFNLQATRTKKAQKMWQEATGKHDTIPDLGVLLDWLMGEIKQLRGIIKELGWRNINVPKQKLHQLSCLYQRKHRKWALKKARNNLEVIYGIANHG